MTDTRGQALSMCVFHSSLNEALAMKQKNCPLICKYVHMGFKILGLNFKVSLGSTKEPQSKLWPFENSFGLAVFSKRLWLGGSKEAVPVEDTLPLRSPVTTTVPSAAVLLKDKLSVNKYLAPAIFSAVGEVQPTDGKPTFCCSPLFWETFTIR